MNIRCGAWIIGGAVREPRCVSCAGDVVSVGAATHYGQDADGHAGTGMSLPHAA